MDICQTIFIGCRLNEIYDFLIHIGKKRDVETLRLWTNEYHDLIFDKLNSQ